MEIQTSVDPAVLWFRARQLCYLGGHAPESGEIIGICRSLKDDMSADLADSLKAGEEDRKSDHATLVAAKENEVATLTATRRTSGRVRSLRDGEPLCRCPGVVRVGGGAPEGRADELRSRSLLRSSPQSMRSSLWLCDSTGACAQRRGCGWFAKAQATARVDVPSAPLQCCGFSCQQFDVVSSYR